jgi:hypothetical protein
MKRTVPQGSCLSPLLFSTFIIYIIKLVLKGLLFLFADDISLIVSDKTYFELETNINNDLNKINNRLIIDKLIPNIEKSSFVTMGCLRKDTNISVKLGSNLLNQTLKRVYQTKLLGLFLVINSNLTTIY